MKKRSIRTYEKALPRIARLSRKELRECKRPSSRVVKMLNEARIKPKSKKPKKPKKRSLKTVVNSVLNTLLATDWHCDHEWHWEKLDDLTRELAKAVGRKIEDKPPKINPFASYYF